MSHKTIVKKLKDLADARHYGTHTYEGDILSHGANIT